MPSTAFDYQDLGNALRTKVRAIIDADLSDGSGEQWDNVEIQDAGTPGSTKTWVRVAILDGDSQQADMGTSNRRFRRTGVLSLGVHVELNRGDAAARAIIDLFVGSLRGVTVAHANGTVTLRAPRVTSLGREDQWWRMDADFPFWSDDFDSAP